MTFVIKTLSDEEYYNAYDHRFCGHSFRLKKWPVDLAVTKTTDQICYISKSYENVVGIAGMICSDLLDPVSREDVEFIEDDFDKFEKNFLLTLVDPDLFDSEEEKIACGKFVIEQIREMAR